MVCGPRSSAGLWQSAGTYCVFVAAGLCGGHAGGHSCQRGRHDTTWLRQIECLKRRTRGMIPLLQRCAESTNVQALLMPEEGLEPTDTRIVIPQRFGSTELRNAVGGHKRGHNGDQAERARGVEAARPAHRRGADLRERYELETDALAETNATVRRRDGADRRRCAATRRRLGAADAGVTGRSGHDTPARPASRRAKRWDCTVGSVRPSITRSGSLYVSRAVATATAAMRPVTST